MQPRDWHEMMRMRPAQSACVARSVWRGRRGRRTMERHTVACAAFPDAQCTAPSQRVSCARGSFFSISAPSAHRRFPLHEAVIRTGRRSRSRAGVVELKACPFFGGPCLRVDSAHSGPQAQAERWPTATPSRLMVRPSGSDNPPRPLCPDSPAAAGGGGHCHTFFLPRLGGGRAFCTP